MQCIVLEFVIDPCRVSWDEGGEVYEKEIEGKSLFPPQDVLKLFLLLLLTQDSEIFPLILVLTTFSLACVRDYSFLCHDAGTK